MAFSFLILLYLQVSYIEEIIRMRQEQFNESVKRSLVQACKNIELVETKKYLEADVEATERRRMAFMDSIVNDKRKFPRPFWANTSSNQIIKDMIWHADEEMKRELDILINCGTIEKQIHEDITYDDIHESEDNLWNFLFFTGYMKKVSERSEDNGDIYLTMKIPNTEIASIYRGQIRNWFEKQIKSEDRSILHKAVLDGDTDAIENYVSELLAKSISTFDGEDSFYHGFFLSLLYGVPNLLFTHFDN